MYILFLLIHLVFAGIFYIFSKNLEAAAFLFWGIVFFFGFFPFSLRSIFESKPKIKNKAIHQESSHALEKSYEEFLSSGSYYFAFASFYVAFLGISYSITPLFSLSFEVLYGITTLTVAIIFMILNFVFLKNETIRRIFYTNTLTVAVVLIVFFLYIWLFHPQFNDTYILLHAIFSIISFLILFLTPNSSRKVSTFIPLFIGFSLFFIIYILTQKFGFSFIPSTLSLLLILSISFFEILLRVPKLRPFREVGLQNAFLLLLICIPFMGIYHIQNTFDGFLGVFMAIYTLFLVYIYQRFTLVLAGILSILSLWYWYIGMFFPGMTPNSFVTYFIFLTIFSFSTLPLDSFFSKTRTTIKVLFSVSILHFIGFSIFSYFLFETFPILWISFLFLWFSSLLFVTYIRFKKS